MRSVFHERPVPEETHLDPTTRALLDSWPVWLAVSLVIVMAVSLYMAVAL